MGTFERHRYPDNWDEMARACKERAGWRCQKCGVAHGETRIGIVSGKEYAVVLAACHVNHDPENPHAQLATLCQVCHLRLDGVQHGKTRKRRRHEAIRAEQKWAGQLDLPLGSGLLDMSRNAF